MDALNCELKGLETTATYQKVDLARVEVVQCDIRTRRWCLSRLLAFQAVGDARVLQGLTPSKRIHSPISPSSRARGTSESSPCPSEWLTAKYSSRSACVVDLTRIPGVVETSTNDILDLIGLSCLGNEGLVQQRL